MSKISIRSFSGLKTFIDPSDIENGYFNTFENIRPRVGYAEAQSLKATIDALSVTNKKLILVDYIFLDEDRQKNYYNNETLVYNYTQNLVKHRIIIVYTTATNDYQIYLDEYTANNLIGNHQSDDSDQYPYLINERGICRILFKEQAYWLGKVERTRWTANDYKVLTDPLYDEQHPYRVFKLFPLVHSLSKGTGWATFTERNDEFQTDIIRDLTGWKWYGGEEANHSIYGWHNKYKFEITVDGKQQFLPVQGENGYFWVFRCRASADGDDFFYAFDEDVKQFLPNLDENVPYGEGSLSTTDNQSIRPYSYRNGGEFKDWEKEGVKVRMWRQIGSAGNDYRSVYKYVTEIVSGVPPEYGYREVGLVANEGIPAEEPYSEYIMTARIDNNEFPIRYDSFSVSSGKVYVVEVNVNVPDTLPIRTEAIVLYGRTAANSIKIKSKDFEQFAIIPLLAKERPYFSSYLTGLTQNGIMLSQVIGKAIDIDTYKIETAYDDYINVNGTPFILKNGNVLYPSVGNGIVHSDMFFPESYIPQVSGKYLTTLENKLAVFEEHKEEMTYVDFQAVEGQLIFFVRGSALYRIKNYWDLIETPEGIIINLSDGVYATNGEKRTLISFPINDIMKRNYLNSSIYYNSYEKEVLYICSEGIYVYRFETDSWSKMEFTGFDGDLTSDDVIDIIDDYAGNMYLVLTNGKIYKIEYQNAVGKFGLTHIDLQELAVGKRLNWIAIDAAGKVNGLSTTDWGDRKVLFFNKMLKDRKPKQWIDFLFEIGYLTRDDGTQITGTIHNMEISLEAFPIRKV